MRIFVQEADDVPLEVARALIEQVRTDHSELTARVIDHPYLSALADGNVPTSRLRVFAEQEYHIIASDTRSYALAATRASSPESRSFLLGMFEGEWAAERLTEYSRELGVMPEELDDSEPLAGAFSYSTCLAWLATHGDESELVGALLVTLPAWQANCAAMIRALQDRYAVPDSALGFLTAQTASLDEFERGALDVVAQGLKRGIAPDRIRRAGRLLLECELFFWDAVYRASCRQS
ncbi:hypothetical protein ACIBL8_46440 [Streptomyces sp. NPDC050523]|uniref:hypothetical protein n=1 Tax=Streptomyces sp. NPDC050523 TaxID=3365622 RepID=UPI0037B1D354